MQQQIYDKKLMRIAYVIVMIFNCICFYNGRSSIPSFQYGNWIFKLSFVFLSSLAMTLLLYYCEKSLGFIGKTMMYIMPSSAVIHIALSFVPFFAKGAAVNGAFFHFIYTALAIFSVFLGAWLLTIRYGSKSTGFTEFYNNFIIGLFPLIIVIFVYMFIVSRDYDYKFAQTNFVLFHGEIGFIITKIKTHSGNFEIYMHSIGNVLFFSVFPLITHKFIKKKYNVFNFIIPLLISVFAEWYQYITHCGDTDIDDVLLNCLGAIIGIIIYHTLIKKYLLEDK